MVYLVGETSTVGIWDVNQTPHFHARPPGGTISAKTCTEQYVSHQSQGGAWEPEYGDTTMNCLIKNTLILSSRYSDS